MSSQCLPLSSGQGCPKQVVTLKALSIGTAEIEMSMWAGWLWQRPRGTEGEQAGLWNLLKQASPLFGCSKPSSCLSMRNV